MENSSLIVYERALIERKSLDNYLRENFARASTINLASDIFTNNYGILGFLITDNKPEDSRGYYPNGDYGYEIEEETWQKTTGWGREDDLRLKCKSVAFEGTFKLVRWIVMPEKVDDFFRSDRYLGEHFIEKIMKEDLIPDEWYNPEDWEEHRFPGGTRGIGEEKLKEYKSLIEKISLLTKWEDDNFPGSNHRAWQSFHLHQDYQLIIKIAQESIITALARFDHFLERFSEGRLSDCKKNLKVTAEEYRLEYLSNNQERV